MLVLNDPPAPFTLKVSHAPIVVDSLFPMTLLLGKTAPAAPAAAAAAVNPGAGKSAVENKSAAEALRAKLGGKGKLDGVSKDMVGWCMNKASNPLKPIETHRDSLHHRNPLNPI